ncbi:MAG: hypothetical protein SP1CHLAM54_11680 [Chlamydiia bacterium]|nr:hypothetical protein [Chlamydiia bacterium]MCH9616071.1 hypothetical protein [Chlamydiia bacterium]MCH9629094.1 hypothetical protein [Chlamydiia bacterium]
MQFFEFPDGATPLDDYSDLIPSWITSLKDLNHSEAENILLAQRKYLSKPQKPPAKWFNPTQLRKIHQAMFGKVWKWAGLYRQSETSIGIKPYKIPMRLSELCYEVESWQHFETTLSLLEQAAIIHHKLVYIHPFTNGNGRFSRLIADRFLLDWDCSYPKWPTQLCQNGDSRQRYITSLKWADKGNYTHLLEFMLSLGASETTSLKRD